MGLHRDPAGNVLMSPPPDLFIFIIAPFIGSFLLTLFYRLPAGRNFFALAYQYYLRLEGVKTFRSPPSIPQNPSEPKELAWNITIGTGWRRREQRCIGDLFR
jgi:hypothetical protein